MTTDALRKQAEAMRQERRGDPIVIDCEAREVRVLEDSIESIEEWPGDPDRVRLIFVDGRSGRWFSRRWTKITTKDVLP